MKHVRLLSDCFPCSVQRNREDQSIYWEKGVAIEDKVFRNISQFCNIIFSKSMYLCNLMLRETTVHFDHNTGGR